VQIEAFAEEFTTGGTPFYPKKMPRNNNANYLQDLSAWAGDSHGIQHVHLKLPGMAGTVVQLRWEYTQDSVGTCTDVRPGHTCGVAFDNIVMNSVVSSTVVTTATSVASSQNPSDSGQPVTLTATVTAGSPVTTGTVTFHEGATILAAAVAVDASGHAAFTTSTLTPGAHAITADYNGTPHFASSSGSIVQTVDALPTFSISDVSLAEGNTGTSNAIFTVTLSAGTHTATATVDFATVDGTATTADHDYAAASGTLLFAPHETTKTISVSVYGDVVIEPNETFFVNLSNATHATIADGQGAGTIENDDTVATTLAALLDQVIKAPRFEDKADLLQKLMEAQRRIQRNRRGKAIEDLREFIEQVKELSRTGARGQRGDHGERGHHGDDGDDGERGEHGEHDRQVRLDPATAATWILEAQSIIAALLTT
jgi:hypothetical protein